ncbi:methyltransferase domain-containing protein [Corallococcus sp. AB011P]|nr:methyltransferase domain-containing protein [Corallococcus sp. AB011P]
MACLPSLDGGRPPRSYVLAWGDRRRQRARGARHSPPPQRIPVPRGSDPMTHSAFDEQRMEIARRAAALLYQRGASRVWVFGSLGRGEQQDRRSDLDLAVEGLPSARLHEATRDVERLAGFHSDVVDSQFLDPHVRAGFMASRQLMARGSAAEGGPPRLAGASRREPVSLPADPRAGLQQQRLDAVSRVLRESGARWVLDLGCGSGALLSLLARESRYEQLTGVDLSDESLAAARRRLSQHLTAEQQGRVQVYLGIVTHRDPRLLGHDAAAAVEVIEHMDPPQRAAFEHVLFNYVRPATLVITTPNAEYNVKWHSGPGPYFRHPDHRFEWTRAEFHAWMGDVARRANYEARWAGIGPDDPKLGPPTQMAVFSRS